MNEAEQRFRALQQKVEDVVEFLVSEFGSVSENREFWECLAHRCTVLSMMPKLMGEAELHKFLKQEIPWGRYAGETVEEVLHKDIRGLEEMALTKLPFQKKLVCFLYTLSQMHT